MSKINYSKVEQELRQALIQMQMKQLAEGKPIISSRAQEFYGITTTPRPVHEDIIEQLLEEEAKKQISQQNETQTPFTQQENIPSLEEPLNQSIHATPTQDSITQAPGRRTSPPKRPELAIDLSHTSETMETKLSPLYILRQHILWMKRQHIDKRYELLGTTQEEVFSLRKKDRLSNEDLLRIKTLIAKAEHVRVIWEKNILKSVSTEELITTQKKKHRTKRFNVRDKWIPL